MYCEIPVFKRCCCCLPLRPSLLAFAYIKLILFVMVSVAKWMDLCTAGTAVEIVLVQTLIFAEVVATVVLLVGGHTKKALPMKIYMWWGIVGAALTLIFVLYVIGLISSIDADPEILATHAVPYVSMYILGLLMQLYVVLLVRSQILKLQGAEEVVKYELGNECVNVGLKV